MHLACYVLYHAKLQDALVREDSERRIWWAQLKFPKLFLLLLSDATSHTSGPPCELRVEVVALIPIKRF
jgi:hypothetical protein